MNSKEMEPGEKENGSDPTSNLKEKEKENPLADEHQADEGTETEEKDSIEDERNEQTPQPSPTRSPYVNDVISAENPAAYSTELPFSVNLFRLDGKVALVTGGSGGIGYEIARTFAFCGASVLITGRTEEKIISAAKALTDETGQKVVGIRSDVTVIEDCENAISEVTSQFGQLDILVNNAGTIGDIVSVEQSSPEGFDKVMALCLKGPYIMTKYAIPQLKKSKAGRIINIGSVASFSATPGFGSYVSSKHGLLGLTRTTALELATTSVTVNMLAPGSVVTPLLQGFVEGQPGVFEAVAATCPMNRIASTREMSGAALYLASDLSSFATGIHLVVSGGRDM